jgi:hypothetical protein
MKGWQEEKIRVAACGVAFAGSAATSLSLSPRATPQAAKARPFHVEREAYPE